MVRLQCPHLALAAPAPQLSSPSVQSANVRRSLSSRSVQQFIPRPCVRSLHSLPGLYRVMRASRSKVTPFPWCCCSWPHSATLGRAKLWGGGKASFATGGAARRSGSPLHIHVLHMQQCSAVRIPMHSHRSYEGGGGERQAPTALDLPPLGAQLKRHHPLFSSKPPTHSWPGGWGRSHQKEAPTILKKAGAHPSPRVRVGQALRKSLEGAGGGGGGREWYGQW